MQHTHTPHELAMMLVKLYELVHGRKPSEITRDAINGVMGRFVASRKAFGASSLFQRFGESNIPSFGEWVLTHYAGLVDDAREKYNESLDELESAYQTASGNVSDHRVDDGVDDARIAELFHPDIESEIDDAIGGSTWFRCIGGIHGIDVISNDDSDITSEIYSHVYDAINDVETAVSNHRQAVNDYKSRVEAIRNVQSQYKSYKYAVSMTIHDDLPKLLQIIISGDEISETDDLCKAYIDGYVHETEWDDDAGIYQSYVTGIDSAEMYEIMYPDDWSNYCIYVDAVTNHK
jgi:hypothetical protein